MIEMDSNSYNEVVSKNYKLWKYIANQYYPYDSASAEDLLADSLLCAWRGWEKFDGRYTNAWLKSIMKNIFINQYRKKCNAKLDYVDGYEGYDIPSSDITADEMIDADNPQLREAIKTLPIEFQEVICLTYTGHSQKEIADIMGTTSGTVSSRRFRALNKLRYELGA